MQLTKENVVFTGKETCGYFSVLQNPQTNKIRIYYRSSYPPTGNLTSPTRYIESDDGIDFHKPKKDIIIQDTGVCHNFFAFYDHNPNITDNKIKGIGGTHWKKRDPFWHIRAKHEGMEKDTPATHGYRGIYIYQSEDGLQWNNISKKPVVSRRSPGFLSRGRRQAREFDSHLSAFYDDNRSEYILYVRANIKQGIRFIQFTTSKDLINWSPFKPIGIKFHSAKDNYYFPNFFRHPSNTGYLGLIPYTNHKNGLLRLVKSTDGVKWKIIEELFSEKPFFHDRQPKNASHPVNGYVLSKDKSMIYFYIHHNYFQSNKKKPVRVIRYSIKLKDLP